MLVCADGHEARSACYVFDMTGQSSRARFVWECTILVSVFVVPLIFNPFAALPFEPAKAQVVRGASILVCGMGLLRYFSPGRRRVLMVPRGVPSGGISLRRLLIASIAAYAGTLALATALSLNAVQSMWGLGDKHGAITTLCIMLFCLSVPHTIRIPSQMDRLLLTILSSSALVSAYGVVQFLGVDPLPWITDSVSPVHSTLGRSNYLGAYLALVLPFSLCLWLRAKRRFWPSVLIAALATCLFVTQARAGWLAAVFACTFFTGMLGFRQRSQRGMGAAAAISILGLALYFPLTSIRVQSYQSVTPPSQVQSKGKSSSVVVPSVAEFSAVRQMSIQRRLIIWRATLHLLDDRWLLGYGPELFTVVFNTVYEPGSLYDGTDILIDDPHNLFIDQFFATGVLGLLALLSVIATFYALLWRELWRNADRDTQVVIATVMASASGFLIQAQFNPDVVTTTVFFWLLVTMALILGRRNFTEVR